MIVLREPTCSKLILEVCFHIKPDVFICLLTQHFISDKAFRRLHKNHFGIVGVKLIVDEEALGQFGVLVEIVKPHKGLRKVT